MLVLQYWCSEFVLRALVKNYMKGNTVFLFITGVRLMGTFEMLWLWLSCADTHSITLAASKVEQQRCMWILFVVFSVGRFGRRSLNSVLLELSRLLAKVMLWLKYFFICSRFVFLWHLSTCMPPHPLAPSGSLHGGRISTVVRRNGWRGSNSRGGPVRLPLGLRPHQRKCCKIWKIMETYVVSLTKIGFWGLILNA